MPVGAEAVPQPLLSSHDGCAPLPDRRPRHSLQRLSGEEGLNCCRPRPPSCGQLLEPALPPTAAQGAGSRAGTYKADASFAPGNEGAHILWPTQEGDDGDVQLLKDLGHWFHGAQAAPAHGQALGAVGQQLALLRELRHCHLGGEIGRAVQLGQSERRWAVRSCLQAP